MHPSNRPVPHLILASDGEDQSALPLPALDIETATPDELRARIHDCGIVGLGGAGFPTARKLGHPANTLVINAAECEPYITCDDLQIRENAADIIHGAQIAAKILGAEHIHFGIEDDKPQAIAALERAAADINDPRLKISSVPTRYPSGNARQLFELLLGVRVPADQHASDYGLICHNSGTMKAVYDAVSLGLPLTERYTTISGEGICEPQVLRIRIGTAARELIQQSGGERHEHSAENRHIIGGPMMGYEIASLDTPLQKTGNSLLILPAAPAPEETPCIRCSRCADACPMELLPQQLLWYSQSNQHNRLKQYRLFDCIECGICAAVCPSGIPLVQYYRHSKGDIRAADKKTQDAEHARARHEARTARLERENISEELVRTILREGEAERINDWTIRFTHDDYRVDVNTASAEIITVIDEYDADYNEAAQASLAQGEYTSLNALELEFSERARTFLKKNPPFVFDLMLQALSSPESVRMAEGWTRIYAAQGLEIAVSPDERTVLALAKTPDFHVLHAENLRKVQLEELSNTLAKQAEDKAAQAENTTEEEK